MQHDRILKTTSANAEKRISGDFGDYVDSGGTARGIQIKIADIVIEVISTDPDLQLGLDGDMALFSCAKAKPDLSIEACRLVLDDNYGSQKIFDSGGAWKLYLKDNAYWFYCSSPSLGKVPYKAARMERDFKSGRVFLHPALFNRNQAVYPLQYPLDELLVLNLLAQGRGAEVHACGLVNADGDGLLFAGQSGAGKTTMAKLWEKEPGITILSDDRIILRQDENRIWMYGTPWHGEAEMATASRAPLKRIFFIRHGEKNSLKSKIGVEAAALLFSFSFPVFYNADALNYTVDFFGKVADLISCHELSVIPNRDVVDFILTNC
ncbi:MAG: hypothetical protein JXA73_22650 [Acidobacteria bacterium]|nr:hypothetical protein [Acidobacteriota bacterium]